MLGVNAIRDHANTFPVKIISQETGGSPGNRRKRYRFIGVNPAFQSGQQHIVNAPVQPPKKTALQRGVFLFFPRELLQSMKQRMNDYDIRMKTIDPRRQDQIERNAAK